MGSTDRRAELLETIGAEALRGLSEAPTERIERPRRRRSRESIDLLRDLRARGELALDLHQTLGVGGEGVVRQATQVALSRPVAVKKLRADRRSGDAEERLLIEACIAGLLEHPNIVPIYDIQLDQDGDLLIVFKRIEGEPWSAVIADPVAAGERLGDGDHLELNLGVLVRVCDAVAYAHDRGIVHRDLKPANVLLGDYGEVYLTDWGIAGAVDDRHGPRIPRLADDDTIVGTPLYMAPEMLAPRSPDIGPSTDIYQLGAVLYECLSGRPPHMADSLDATLASIREGPPPLDDSIEPRLVEICARAMAVDPASRYPSATALKRALEAYLRRRGALGVLERASLRLATLREEVAAAEPGEAPRLRVYRLLSECRFGFSEVAEAFPDASRAGVRDAVMAAVDYELEHGTPEAAEIVIAELADPPGEAVDRIASAIEARRRRDAETLAYAEIGRRHDPSRGHRLRKLFAVIMGAAVLFPPAGRLIAWYGFAERLPPMWGVISALISLSPLCALAIIYRHKMRQSALTQAAAVAVGTGILISLILSTMTVVLSWNPWLARVIYMFSSAGITATFALAHLPRLLPSALAFLVAGVLVSLDQHDIDHRDWLTVLANGTLIANALWVWWPRPEEPR